MLVDLPSGRELEVELEHDLIRFGGLNERGEFVYARRILAGNSPSGIWRSLVGETIAGPMPEDEYRVPCVDVAHSTEREIAALEGPPRLMSLGPRGDLLIATHYADGSQVGSGVPTLVRALEISTGTWHDLEHHVGEVFSCDWLPNGQSFALSGSEGGELFRAIDLSSVGTQPAPFGLFTPDGSAYLAPSATRSSPSRVGES